MYKNTDTNYKQKKLPRELITVHDFSECANIRKKEHTKTKVAIYCQTCKRFHHLHFGEFKKGYADAKCLQDIIDKYAWKYCYRESSFFKININQKTEDTEEDKIARIIGDKIQKLQGDKIVTITLSYDNNSLVETFQYHIVGDLSKETQEEKMVRTFFMHNKIKWGLEKNNHAGILVRQITSLQTEINGKMENVHKIYGIIVGNGHYKFLNKKEIELAYNTDAKTGKPLPAEKNIIYGEFSN
jgi:ferritin-like protein